MAMSHMLRLTTAALVALLLAGCTGIPAADVPAGMVDGDAAAVTSAVTPSATLPGTDVVAAALTVEEIAVDGRTATFPAQIDAAKQELGADGDAVSHRYVEVTGTDGTLWQGEWLANATQSVVFLQVRGAGQTALRMAGDAALTPSAVADALPDGPPAVGPMPDVQVEAVNPQQTGETDAGVQWRFDVTVSHPDTGWEDYVDAWLVIGPDGTVYGTRILLHPHEAEQPFTRSLSGVWIPVDVTEVTIRPHDLVSGYDDGLTVPLMMGPQPTPTQ